MNKLLLRYKNENNKPVDVVMDPRELGPIWSLLEGNRTLYKVYDAEDEFNSELDRITKLATS
jgi:hypothetical protein